MKVRTIHTLQRARQMIATGTVLELPDAEAQPLIAKGAVVAVATLASAPAASRASDPLIERFAGLNAKNAVATLASAPAASRASDPLIERLAGLNAKNAIAAIGEVVVPELLEELRQLETTREKGPRKSVLDAIAEQEQTLGDADVDGDDASDEGTDDTDAEG